MKKNDWDDLTSSISQLDEYKNLAYSAFDGLIDNLPNYQRHKVINHQFFQKKTISQMADEMKKDLGSYIDKFRDCLEIILSDVAKDLYDYNNPLIQLAITQAINYLKTQTDNYLKRLQAAKKILSQASQLNNINCN